MVEAADSTQGGSRLPAGDLDLSQLPLDADSLITQGIIEAGSPARKEPEQIQVPSTPSDEVDESTEQDEALLPPEDDDEEESDETPDQPTASAGEDASTEASEGDGETAAVQRWAEVLVEKPQRLSEVPAKHRVAVFEASIELAARLAQHVTSQELQQVAQKEMESIRKLAYRQGYDQAKNDLVTEQEMSELDSLAEDNPAEFARLARSTDVEDRSKMERYLAWKKDGATQTPVLSPYQVAARDLFEEMKVTQQETEALNRADAEHAKQYGVRRYAPSLDGLRQLEADIKVLRQGYGTQTRKPDTAVRAAAASRQNAAKKLKDMPKPDVGGRVADKPVSDDISVLISEGWNEALKEVAVRGAR